MEKEKIARINELARTSRVRELTEQEKAEQKSLREEYLAEFRLSFGAQLDHTVIVEPDGTRIHLKDRKKTQQDSPKKK